MASCCAPCGVRRRRAAATAGATECVPCALLQPDVRVEARARRARTLTSLTAAHVRQVETTPEQLALASQNAERAGAATGTTTRVIGWYHSHPHITVLPSAVGMLPAASLHALLCGL